jgi:hypothetical protein
VIATQLDAGSFFQPGGPLPLDVEGRRTLEELVVALRANRGQGAIILVECDSPLLRRGLYAELARRLEGWAIQAVEMDGRERDLPCLLIEVARPESDALFVAGLEQAMPEVAEYLNYRREVLLQLSKPILLWVTEPILAELMHRARDFWVFRRHLFEFRLGREALLQLARQLLAGELDEEQAGEVWAAWGRLAKEDPEALQALA